MALEKQMDLFQEGGMIDEGGTTDPVSGNDVPTGSLKKEVRDDIPAQLSEGEFVMPADVVRFHGLDKMMALRDEAKMGLQRMEDMGQMGNSEEATIPDGIPFNMDDLELEDEPMEMQVGGFVQPSFPAYRPGQQGRAVCNNLSLLNISRSLPLIKCLNILRLTTQAIRHLNKHTHLWLPHRLQPLRSLLGQKLLTYVNADGNEIQIPVGEDGTPLIPVPPGYTLKSDTPVTADPTTDPAQQQTQVASTQTQQEDPSYISPEVWLGKNKEAKKLKHVKKLQKNLVKLYKRSLNPLEGLLGALVPGAVSIWYWRKEQEVGTIMPDGTISDGQGNTFDPITGQQMGGKGFLGLGKSEAEKFGLPEEGEIPESSLRDLRSVAGEQSADC